MERSLKVIDICYERESDQVYYTDGMKALAFAKDIPEAVYPEMTDIHFYWRVPLEFGRKQALPIRSAIVTQNLKNIRINVWSNVDLSQNEWIQPLAQYINLRHFDAEKEAVGTPLEGHPALKRTDSNCWLDGDLFRLLILWKYGGAYVDCDAVLLRDLAPLLSQEFVYQWGTEHYPKPKLNGAVMRLFKGSRTATDFLEMLKKIPGGTNSTNWGSELYGFVRQFNKDFTVFPCAFFNTEWQLYINMGESAHPFRKGNDSGRDFPGAFTWHWHNKWEDPIEEGSKFWRLEQQVNEKYAAGFDYAVDKDRLHLGGNYGGGDSGTFYPVLWQSLWETYGITSILDVGCGEGHAVKWFLDRHISAVGLDGLTINVEKCPNTCFEHDLAIEPYIAPAQFDLVWCCEVVEHIEEKYLDNLLKTLANGNYIAITAAQPGQEGWHHVNCQPRQYWIDKLDAMGYQYLNRETEHLRELAHGWFRMTGMLFVKRVTL